MKKILLGALGALGFGTALAAGLIHAGLIDVAADTPHGPVVHRLVEWARERSITRRAASIAPPGDLSAAARIRRGAGNYDAMCTGCHLAPGMKDTEIRKGLYPPPPKLADPVGFVDSTRMDARRFWIVKHGIKASGMPAWVKAGMEDADIWDLIAFVKVLPSLSPQDYRRQVEASAGHSHAGMARGSGRAGGAGADSRQAPMPHADGHGSHEH